MKKLLKYYFLFQVLFMYDVGFSSYVSKQHSTKGWMQEHMRKPFLFKVDIKESCKKKTVLPSH